LYEIIPIEDRKTAMGIKIPEFSSPFSFDKFTPKVLMKIPVLNLCVIQA
jgi:hypothetical protein